jgi:hypothetical protein
VKDAIRTLPAGPLGVSAGSGVTQWTVEPGISPV